MKRNIVPRKTVVRVDGVDVCLNEYYADTLSEYVNYATFRQRIKSAEKRGILNENVLRDAISLDNIKWINFYGGGRRKPFIYTGSKFKEYYNQKFESLSSFLQTINKYERYSLIKSRLLNGWEEVGSLLWTSQRQN